MGENWNLTLRLHGGIEIGYNSYPSEGGAEEAVRDIMAAGIAWVPDITGDVQEGYPISSIRAFLIRQLD